VWRLAAHLAGSRTRFDGHDAISEGRQEMNETCDRCGPAVGALYRVHRDGALYLCGHCAHQLWPALAAQGWTIWPIREPALALPAI
jgi:ribosomal protein S27AE